MFSLLLTCSLIPRKESGQDHSELTRSLSAGPSSRLSARTVLLGSSVGATQSDELGSG